MNRKERIVLAIAVLIPFAIVAYSFYIGMFLWGIILALPLTFILILLINPMKRSFEGETETIGKDKWWIYLIFFLIGIVSFIISVVLGNVFFLPLLICSFLFAIAMYKFKRRTFGFALMAFALSIATSTFIFFIGIIFGAGFLEGAFTSFYPLIILLILSVIAWIAFKEQPLVIFSLKAFVVAFGTIFIIFSAVFMANSNLSLLLFFGDQNDATTSTSIHIESSSENITIYVPVLLDENKNVLKMYENPEITGNVTTAVIDTEYGKALMISRSGLGDHLFNWNEVPGKDTDLFVKWLDDTGYLRARKPDISKSDDGRAITLSGKMYDDIYQLNEVGVLEHYGVNNNVIHEIRGGDLLFTKEENGKLNIYSGNNEIRMNENHGILKEDTQTSDEFFKRFTISMSNYTSPEPFIQQHDPELRTFGAWVYSDSEVENVRFYFHFSPENRIDRTDLSIRTEGGMHLREGWQVVNLSVGMSSWD